MEFQDKVKQLAARAEAVYEQIQTEEATKTALVLPFFSLLGYDVFDPYEFVPEYTADIGIKKGEKVDYAIMIDEKPVILVEAKNITEPLDKHGSQLFRYFTATEAKFGILTNGIVYQFYTDLDAQNKLDETPFLEIDMFNLKDNLLNELKKFEKSNFNMENILDTASELKYSSLIKKVWENELLNPSDDLIRFFLNSVYDGMRTQTIIDKFRPIIKRSLLQYINEVVNGKIKTAIKETDDVEIIDESINPDIVDEKRTEPTKKELEAFFIVRAVIGEHIINDDITFKINNSYFSIIYKNMVSKWMCRLILEKKEKIYYHSR